MPTVIFSYLQEVDSSIFTSLNLDGSVVFRTVPQLITQKLEWQCCTVHCLPTCCTIKLGQQCYLTHCPSTCYITQVGRRCCPFLQILPTAAFPFSSFRIHYMDSPDCLLLFLPTYYVIKVGRQCRATHCPPTYYIIEVGPQCCSGVVPQLVASCCWRVVSSPVFPPSWSRLDKYWLTHWNIDCCYSWRPYFRWLSKY